MASRYNTSAGEKGQMESRPDDSMFASPSAVSDVTLIVDGKKLHVSKCVLGLASPVFLKMFEGDFKDKTEIPLADKKYEDMVELLLCIYPSTSKLVTEVNLHAVLPLADEYGIESMKMRCESFMLSLFKMKEEEYNDPPNKELIHFLYLADKYKLAKLMDVCVDKVKFRTYDGENGVKCLPEFQLMTADTKFRVLSEKISQLETPVKNVLLKGKAAPSGDKTLKVITDPDCSGCKSPNYHAHDGSLRCREGVTTNLQRLLDQLCKLDIHFHKDPSLK